MKAVVETAGAVNARALTAAQVARGAMAGIVNSESGPHRLNAFISFDYESAVAQAQSVDAQLDHGARLPLAGVCIGVKDNIATLDLPTTCGSRILAGYRSPFEATVVRRLRACGAIIAGKTNLDEFAMGSSTEHSAFGATTNPHDRTRVPGGSSGGSAAAVAAGLVHAALGSDTGGSVRQPAAFCGVVGLKPTWGAVSRYGLAAFASSLDTIGVLARSVADAAVVFRAIRGPDERDATSHLPQRRVDTAVRVIGVPREYVEAVVDPWVRERFEAACERLRTEGIELRDISLPHTRFALASYMLLAAAEASTNLARYDGIRFGPRPAQPQSDMYRSARNAFGAEARRRILLGTFAASAAERGRHFEAASRARALVAAELHQALTEVDLLFTPTAPERAFALGERRNDAAAMYASDVLTVPASLAGLPAISIPLGAADGLPAGGQFIGPALSEERLLLLAEHLEQRLLA